MMSKWRVSLLAGVVLVLLLAAGTSADARCCEGTTGDLDNDASVTMGDLTVLIDHLFVSLAPLACPAEADCDGSPGVTMGDLTVFLDHLFVSLAPMPPCPYEDGWAALGHGACKTFKVDGTAKEGGYECVQWQYTVETGALHVTHTNATFNCCPVMRYEVEISGDTIFINEIEIEGLCDCICPFDFEYELYNVPMLSFTVAFNPYYWPPDQDPLICDIDLALEPQGECCIWRPYLPDPL